jgi:predicted membrane-bound dolichyl-phosphate-mannose-protein mannosyltransferase
MSRPPLSYLTAYLQFTIAVLFLLGYFGFLAMLFLVESKISEELTELGKTLAVGLSGALGLLFAFLYLRSRAEPDPPKPPDAP